MQSARCVDETQAQVVVSAAMRVMKLGRNLHTRHCSLQRKWKDEEIQLQGKQMLRRGAMAFREQSGWCQIRKAGVVNVQTRSSSKSDGSMTEEQSHSSKTDSAIPEDQKLGIGEAIGGVAGATAAGFIVFGYALLSCCFLQTYDWAL